MVSIEVDIIDFIYVDILWKIVDILCGQVDVVEYKYVVFGLLFFKYIFDSFESCCDDLCVELMNDGIKGEQFECLFELCDEYIVECVFWVLFEVCWLNLQN